MHPLGMHTRTCESDGITNKAPIARRLIASNPMPPAAVKARLSKPPRGKAVLHPSRGLCCAASPRQATATVHRTIAVHWLQPCCCRCLVLVRVRVLGRGRGALAQFAHGGRGAVGVRVTLGMLALRAVLEAVGLITHRSPRSLQLLRCQALLQGIAWAGLGMNAEVTSVYMAPHNIRRRTSARLPCWSTFTSLWARRHRNVVCSAYILLWPPPQGVGRGTRT